MTTASKNESWLSWMSMSTVILAVCATLSTFKGSGYSTQSVINQTMASDQWAFYQAKKTKAHIYEVQIDQLRLQAMTLPPKSTSLQAYQAKINEYEEQIAKYAKDEAEITAQAKALEKQRDMAKLHNKPFGYAVVFLQVAILLNSIAGLLKMQRFWWCAIPIGLVGIVFFANGFLLFF